MFNIRRSKIKDYQNFKLVCMPTSLVMYNDEVKLKLKHTSV